AQEKEKLAQEKVKLVQEKEKLVREKVKLVQEKNQLTMEKNELRAMNNRLSEEKKILENKITAQQHPTITINVGQNAPYCPPGWQLHMSSCYQRSSSTSNWDCASQDCARKESHLVILNDEDEEKLE
ncbi:hypothetical protein FQN60_017324, partial [Etheostoma spectabile]